MATTAAATTTSPLPPPSLPPPPPSESPLTVEALKHIDISLLSQSDLHALSLCTRSAHDVRNTTNDNVPVKIDRSIFNESAGSRRQTYSRLRLRHSHHRTTRIPGLLPGTTLKPSTTPSTTDVEDGAIIHYLKHFLDHGVTSAAPPPPPPPPPRPQPQPQPEILSNTPLQYELGLGFEQNTQIENIVIEQKKKKGKGKRKLKENGVGIELQKLNKKGELVDFSVLEANGDNLYSEELKTRTVGLENEEGILGFLSSIEGQWCSRRKRRKYIDANEFGDSLPLGWKLLLSPKRRDGRSFVYIRRYISPTGQQFLSCKEAAEFLRAHFAHQPIVDENHETAPSSIQQIDTIASSSNAVILSTSVDENLAEVQVQDLFECYKCNMSFDEKNAYLQHLFSFHEQTTKRVKFGKPIGEGVIIRDGKYECQFCHKVFNEKRKYNCHVGVHARTLKSPEELLITDTSPIQSGPTLTDSTIDLSIEKSENPLSEDLNVIEQPLLIQTQNIEVNETNNDFVGLNLEFDDVVKYENNEEKVNFSISEVEKVNFSIPEEEKVNFTIPQEEKVNNSLIIETNVNEVTPSSEFFMQSLDYFPTFASISNKGDNEFMVVDQNIQNGTEFEELRLDGIGPFEYNFTEVQGSSSLTGGTFDMENDVRMEEGFNSPVRFNSDEVILNMESENQITTLCVWCRSEFKLDIVDSETNSDTIGYMCPTCKDRISGHFDPNFP